MRKKIENVIKQTFIAAWKVALFVVALACFPGFTRYCHDLYLQGGMDSIRYMPIIFLGVITTWLVYCAWKYAQFLVDALLGFLPPPYGTLDNRDNNGVNPPESPQADNQHHEPLEK
jgi:hypothetical protein